MSSCTCFMCSKVSPDTIFAEQIPPNGTSLGFTGTSGFSNDKHFVQPYLFRFNLPITFGQASSADTLEKLKFCNIRQNK